MIYMKLKKYIWSASALICVIAVEVSVSTLLIQCVAK